MKKALVFAYGAVVYLFFFATFLYLIAFIENWQIPGIVDKTIETGTQGSVLAAIVINLGLILLFGVQHSIMARKSFKAAITRYIPQSAERSTFVLVSTIILAAMIYFWRPMVYTFWDVNGSVLGHILTGISILGWAILLLATFLINHFRLFGLEQIYNQFTGRTSKTPRFVTPFLYKIVRHPLYLGFVIAFWFTPLMTVGHLLLSIGFTSYILVGIHYEEKDLAADLGESYRDYQKEVPKLIPTRLPKKEVTNERVNA